MNERKGTQICVRISREERLSLLKRFDLSDELREQLLSINNSNPSDVWLGREEALAIREQAGELFQEFGFGPDDSVSQEGKLLEDLIDKFFVG